MPRKPLEILTFEKHLRFGKLLYALQLQFARVTRDALSRRVPAAVLDAGLKVERRLALLGIRLADSVSTQEGFSPYVLEAPELEPPFPRKNGRLSAMEHCALGANLHQLRTRAMDLAAEISVHHVKSSRIGKAVHTPERAIDSLRCKLDDLFCVQHPEDFDPRVYYPGFLPTQINVDQTHRSGVLPDASNGVASFATARPTTPASLPTRHVSSGADSRELKTPFHT